MFFFSFKDSRVRYAQDISIMFYHRPKRCRSVAVQCLYILPKKKGKKKIKSNKNKWSHKGGLKINYDVTL